MENSPQGRRRIRYQVGRRILIFINLLEVVNPRYTYLQISSE